MDYRLNIKIAPYPLHKNKTICPPLFEVGLGIVKPYKAIAVFSLRKLKFLQRETLVSIGGNFNFP